MFGEREHVGGREGFFFFVTARQPPISTRPHHSEVLGEVLLVEGVERVVVNANFVGGLTFGGVVDAVESFGVASRIFLKEGQLPACNALAARGERLSAVMVRGDVASHFARWGRLYASEVANVVAE